MTMRGKVGVEEWSSYRGDNLNLQLLALVVKCMKAKTTRRRSECVLTSSFISSVFFC